MRDSRKREPKARPAPSSTSPSGISPRPVRTSAHSPMRPGFATSRTSCFVTPLGFTVCWRSRRERMH